MVFAGRSNIFIWATGWKLSTFNLFRRHIARVTTILAIVHSVGYTIQAFVGESSNDVGADISVLITILENDPYYSYWKELYWVMDAVVSV